MSTNPPHTEDDVRICARVAKKYPNADELAAKYHNHKTLLALVVDEGGIPTYRPTLDCCDHPELATLADAYDAVQMQRGDPRRAYRGLACLSPHCTTCATVRARWRQRRPKRRTSRDSETARLTVDSRWLFTVVVLHEALIVAGLLGIMLL